MKAKIIPTTDDQTQGVRKVYQMIKETAKLNDFDEGHFINALMLFIYHFKKRNHLTDEQVLKLIGKMIQDDNFEAENERHTDS